mgnify:CR=1 FL=1
MQLIFDTDRFFIISIKSLPSITGFSSIAALALLSRFTHWTETVLLRFQWPEKETLSFYLFQSPSSWPWWTWIRYPSPLSWSLREAPSPLGLPSELKTPSSPSPYLRPDRPKVWLELCSHLDLLKHLSKDLHSWQVSRFNWGNISRNGLPSNK